MKFKNCFVIAILAFVCSAAPASASVTEYTDYMAFNTAISGATSYNFEGIAPVNGFSIGDTTVGVVTFTAPGSIPFIIGDNFYGSTTFGGVAFFSGQGPGPNPADHLAPFYSYATATLAGATAIGFYYGPGDDAGNPITATLSTGDTFSLPVPSVVNSVFIADFVGFTSSTPITSVAFTEQGYGMDIITFELGTAAGPTPAPEPTTMLLLGLGLVGLAGVRRKFKN